MNAFYLLFLFLFLAVGCGAASPILSEDPNSLSARSREALWHSENGGEAFSISTPDLAATEEGPKSRTIVLKAPKDQSNYIHGVYSLDLPDDPTIKFFSYVGFPANVETSAIFRIYIQDGSNFPVLAEVLASADHRLDRIEVDLTPYRGQHRLLILSVSSIHGEPLMAPALWIDPILSSSLTL